MSEIILMLAQFAIALLTTYFASLMTQTRLIVVDVEQQLFELKTSSKLIVLTVG